MQCTVLNQSCVGNHSVYWLIHTSPSHPKIIKVHGMSNTQCEWSSEAGHRERKCVYSVSKKAFTISGAGTHYCAVVACGEMLFGNGTRLHITGTVCFVFSCKCIVNIVLFYDVLKYADPSFLMFQVMIPQIQFLQSFYFPL